MSGGNVIVLSQRRELTVALERAIVEIDDKSWPSPAYPGSGDDPGFIVSRTREPFRPAPGVVEEAKRRLPEAMSWLTPVTPEELQRWLLAINVVVGNGRDEGDFKVYFASAWITLSQFPGRCFDDDSLIEAQTEFEFFPSVAKVVALIEPTATALRLKVANIARLAAHRDAPPLRPPTVYDFGDDDLSRCIETWNAMAERMGLEAIEAKAITVAAHEGLATIIRRHGHVRWQRALDNIAESPWIRSRPYVSFNWLAEEPERFTRV